MNTKKSTNLFFCFFLKKTTRTVYIQDCLISGCTLLLIFCSWFGYRSALF